MPATPGVVHVLDTFTATILCFAAAGAAFTPALAINSGAGFINYALLAFSGGAVGTDVQSLSSLDLATTPGGALVVQFNAATLANYNELITIQGHDI